MCYSLGLQVRDLDPNAIQTRVDETHRLNYKMVKSKPQDAVAGALKAELDAFKEQMPLLQEVSQRVLPLSKPYIESSLLWGLLPHCLFHLVNSFSLSRYDVFISSAGGVFPENLVAR